MAEPSLGGTLGKEQFPGRGGGQPGHRYPLTDTGHTTELCLTPLRLDTQSA